MSNQDDSTTSPLNMGEILARVYGADGDIAVEPGNGYDGETRACLATREPQAH